MDIAAPRLDDRDRDGLVQLCDRMVVDGLEREAPARVADARAFLTPLLASLAASPDAIWRADAVFRTLRRLGYFDLSVGRLFEGHVNAVQLIDGFGTDEQRERTVERAARGALYAVWSADDPAERLWLRDDGVLIGRKVMCSGAGEVDGAIVTAHTPRGPVLIMLDAPDMARFSVRPPWPLDGMEATNSLGFDVTGTAVHAGQVIGHPGDYLREPAFSGGIWRILAMQVGALDRLQDALATHVAARDQSGLPAQRRRLLENAIDGESAALWVGRAAMDMEAAADTDAALARVALARDVVVAAAERISARLQRGMGLGLHRTGNPVGRFLRDLNCVLRQPAPDLALDRAEPWLQRVPAAIRWAG
ncbi:acyl-CoA dehydrogenase family protein [Plastoroseomonas arctica]|uniref:Acyl-CoA dehydrogenase n=1 Tax=Plastoroseomonas arctica TaxID=1509237 RepID=A0AAF1KMT9_9PROT|nr:acyl-CoA dehydrogenase [Plastoroseomonas arctica]MBR0656831.1 acyl-CoA dehydrogenase [Plastoroseomonas arctica]